MYPKIKDPNFSDKIDKKYKKYTIPKKKKTFKQICFPKEFKLTLPQQFLAQYINPNTPYKGVLVYHRIGAGKTCTAVNICESWKGKRKIIVVTPASLKGNFRTELRSPCAGNNYLTKRERKQLSELHPSSKEYRDIINRSDKRINKYYTLYSYNKFVDLAEYDELNLNNTLLVIDEIQNMVSETGKFYKVLYDTIQDAPSSLRMVLLSATPMFDKPVEIALTMNLLRIPFEFETGRHFENTFIEKKEKPHGKITFNAKNLDIFKERIKGYVSYFRGAPPYTFPEAIVRYVKCEMSDFQYKSYLTVLETEKRKTHKKKKRHRGFRSGSILELPNNFFIGTRMISNIAFPNKEIGEDGYVSFTNRYLKGKKLKKCSVKFHKIITRLNRVSGTAFVYSNFTEYGGIKSFKKVLKAYGFKSYVKFGEGRKRFAVLSGSEKPRLKDEITAVFNQVKNSDGSRLKILVLSPAIKEGYSFKGIQQVHIMEPYWNISRLSQIIGRAVRYCSHKYMPKEKREVKVWIYMATHTNQKETIDQYIRRLAKEKGSLINQFELALKEIAVDCTLFKRANVFPGEEDIKCEK